MANCGWVGGGGTSELIGPWAEVYRTVRNAGSTAIYIHIYTHTCIHIYGRTGVHTSESTCLYMSKYSSSMPVGRNMGPLHQSLHTNPFQSQNVIVTGPYCFHSGTA